MLVVGVGGGIDGQCGGQFFDMYRQEMLVIVFWYEDFIQYIMDDYFVDQFMVEFDFELCILFFEDDVQQVLKVYDGVMEDVLKEIQCIFRCYYQ